VEAADARDAPARYLNAARRLRRRRALANLRAIAAGKSAIPLAEVVPPLGIPLTARPHIAPLATSPAIISLDPAAPVHVAAAEQEIVRTADVRSLIRRLSHSPEQVPPILLVRLGGSLFLNDGHHRLVASRMLGTPVSAEVHGLQP
jgi:hypothetical protein